MGRIVEVLVGGLCVAVGVVNVLLNEVDIAPLLHNNTFNLLLDVQVLLHPCGQFLELFGGYLQLLGRDFLLEDHPPHPLGQLFLVVLHIYLRITGQVELVLFPQQLVLALLVYPQRSVLYVADLCLVPHMPGGILGCNQELGLCAEFYQLLTHLHLGLWGVRCL